MGVPSCGWAMIAPGGQAVTQSLHFVQRSRKSGSSTAPGGRSQSLRTAGGGGFAGTPSACLTSSRAALTVEITESFRNSRRPYEGLVATIVDFLQRRVKKAVRLGRR